jgi:hypothetical protein
MSMTGKVVITRKWGSAEVEVVIHKRGEMPDGSFINLYTDLFGFREMLREELKKTNDVDAAIDAVLGDIKATTNKIMK